MSLALSTTYEEQELKMFCQNIGALNSNEFLRIDP